MHKFFILGIAALIWLIWYSWHYWQQNQYLGTTDARVTAHLVAITSPFNGKIAVFYVQNHSLVTRGQPLFQLDQARYRFAVAAAQEKLYQIQQQVKTEEEAISTAEKAITHQQTRVSALSKQAFEIHNQAIDQELTADSADDINTQLAMAQEGLELAEQQLETAYQVFGQTFGRPGEAEKEIKAAKEVLAAAQLKLDYTTVSAPAAGVVTGLKLHPGAKISTQQTLFTLAEDNEWWLNANFTSKKLHRVKPNQHVTIKLSQYPNHIFNGTVSEVYPRRKNVALVKIRILDPVPQFPLDVGAKATAQIDLQPKS